MGTQARQWKWVGGFERCCEPRVRGRSVDRPLLHVVTLKDKSSSFPQEPNPSAVAGPGLRPSLCPSLAWGSHPGRDTHLLLGPAILEPPAVEGGWGGAPDRPLLPASRPLVPPLPSPSAPPGPPAPPSSPARSQPLPPLPHSRSGPRRLGRTPRAQPGPSPSHRRRRPVCRGGGPRPGCGARGIKRASAAPRALEQRTAGSEPTARAPGLSLAWPRADSAAARRAPRNCPGPGPGPSAAPPPARPSSRLPPPSPAPSSSRLPSCPVRVMPSLPAPPAPLLLLGLLLLGPRPVRGAGPEPPALPIRPEKEPLPIRGAAGRWAPQGGAEGKSAAGESVPAPRGRGRRWFGAARGRERRAAVWARGAGDPGTQGPLAAPGAGTGGAGQRLPANPVPAGCSFGGKVYALDETWHPDLGEPFGVMRCVLCACETVSAPSGPGRAPRGRGSAGVLGVGVDAAVARRKKRACGHWGCFPGGGLGEEAPPSRLRCWPLLIAHYVPGCLPAPSHLSLTSLLAPPS